MGKILILTDGKAGHENQSKAFARALGCDFEIVEVHFKSKFHKALSYLLDRLGIRTLSLFDSNDQITEYSNILPGPPRQRTADRRQRTEAFFVSNDPTIQQSNPFPVAVLGTGSGTFYAAKALARKLGVKCGVVLYPRGYDIASFDCILAPAFDRPKSAPNVIEIPANLVANDAAFYEKGVTSFREHYAKTAGRSLADAPDATAVIIGGPNKCSTMTVDWMKHQLDTIFHSPRSTPPSQPRNLEPPQPRNFETSKPRNLETSQPSQTSQTPQTPQTLQTSLWVTTSRRTPPDVEALVDSYPWDYKLIYSRDHFNPIPAFVSLAKRLYVTAESTGMLSEACTFGTAEVVPLDNLKPGPHKFRRFMEGLVAAGCSRGVKLDLSAQFAAARKLMGL